jgi:hypothetical protein
MFVDGRYCTNVRDVRNMRGVEIELGHFLMRAKIRFKIKRRLRKVKEVRGILVNYVRKE